MRSMRLRDHRHREERAGAASSSVLKLRNGNGGAQNPMIERQSVLASQEFELRDGL